MVINWENLFYDDKDILFKYKEKYIWVKDDTLILKLLLFESFESILCFVCDTYEV